MAKRTLLTWAPVGIVAGLLIVACGGDDGSSTGATCSPTAEVCDGKDNNCNGSIDENLTQACEENGENGTQACVNGAWGTCETSCTPSAETCDGVDNDCDNAIDEDDAGQALTQTCTDTAGLAGTQICTAGAWGACSASCTPSPEVCDGQDNDCDGKVDEDDAGQALKQDCSNECGLGTEVCANGQWTSCTAPQPETEVCDGVDNDCDKEIDEDFDCARGEQDNCGTDVGTCEFGTKICSNSCEWGACLGATDPVTEACEGVNDEDCDGQVDNGCGCTNGAIKECCGGTTITCTGGVWPSCPTPPIETCNGTDDDCDGKIDEGLPVNPYQLDEDISGTDDCAHADSLTIIAEGAGAQSFSRHLYKDDLTADRDFFFFRTDENSDLFGCIDGPYECYTAVVKLSGPAGTDYDFCVYDVGFTDLATTCGDPEQKICASDEAPFDEVTVNWQGDCGFTDDRDFYLEVFPKTGSALSCEPYTFTIENLDNVPQPDACTF